MENHAVNWEEVYASLQIESLKQSGKWMFAATLVAGIFIVGILSLIFRKYPVAILFMAAGALLFSGKYALGVWRLSKNPRVYSGSIIAKIENSHKQESTATRYISHRIKLNAESGCELTSAGLGEIKNYTGKKLKVNCSKEIYNTLNKADKLTVVIMQHDNSVAWFKKNER